MQVQNVVSEQVMSEVSLSLSLSLSPLPCFFFFLSLSLFLYLSLARALFKGKAAPVLVVCAAPFR